MVAKRARRTQPREGERGQILILFTLAIVVIFAFTALVVDLGMLRNNRQRLVNALDAGALAGARYLPIDLAESGASSVPDAVARIEDLIQRTVSASFPGLTTPDDYTIEYRCAIGRDPATAQPAFARDIPLVCDPTHTIGASQSSWTVDAGPDSTWLPSGSAVYHSACNPRAGDVCNVVALRGTVATQFSFARIVGVNEGNSASSGNTDGDGLLVSAACSAPTCGVRKDPVPVDVVLILDRTLSMVQSGDQNELRQAARAVLGAYDPSLVRVALGLLGPSRTATTCSGVNAPAKGLIVLPPEPPVTTKVPLLVADSGNPVAAANRGSGANAFRSVRINRAGNSSNQTGNLLIATIAINGNANVTTLPTGWHSLRTVTQGSELRLSTFYKLGTNSEPDNYDFRVGSGVTAVGSILRFSGVDTSSAALTSLASGANNRSGSTNSGSGSTSAVATGVTPTTADNMLLGVWALDRNGSFSPPNPQGTQNDMDEQFDGDANDSGVTLMAATDPHETATATSNRTATASGNANGARWASQLLVLPPTPVVQPPPVPAGNRYGESIPTTIRNPAPTSPVADEAKWIPVNFSDDYRLDNGNLNTSSELVKAIACFDFSQQANDGFSGTNLTTPIKAASYYLQQYGNPNAKWGIIFETDGQPQRPIDDHVDLLGSAIDTNNFTCAAANTAATTAKRVVNPSGKSIEIYTIGYNFNNPPNCPDSGPPFRNRSPAFLLSEMGSSPEIDTGNCSTAFRATENDDGGHFYCAGQGVNPAEVFKEVAGALIDFPPGLMQYYPIPEVTSVGGGAPGTVVTISGRNFTDTHRVTFGTTGASIVGVSPTSIQVRVPGGAGTTNVRVTTPYGTSAITAGSRFTYP